MPLRQLLCAALGVALLAWPRVATPQALPVAQPGEITTIPVPLSGVAGASNLRYRIEPLAGVRIMGSMSGTIDALGLDAPVLPITFSVPRDQSAGVLTVAHIEVEDGERRSTIELRTLIGTRYSLEAAFQDTAPSIVQGKAAVLRYRLANRGNAVDSVRLHVEAGRGWRIAAHARELALAPGEEITGTVRVVAPPEAVAGAMQGVRLLASGRGGDSITATIRLRVTGATAGIPGLNSLPGTVFIGTADPSPGELGFGSIGFALEAAGPVAPDTDLQIAWRHRPDDAHATALRGDLFGPKFRAGLRRPTWSLAAGEVFTPGALATGRPMHGRGLDFRWTGESLRGELFLARPFSDYGADEPGHLLRAGTGLRTNAGEFDLWLADLQQPIGPAQALYRSQSAAVTYELLASAGQRLSAEAGVMRLIDPTGGETLGPAGEVWYSLYRRRASLSARARTVPASIPGTGPRSEGYLGGSAVVVDGVSLEGSLFTYSAPTEQAADDWRSQGGSAGVRFFSRGSHLRLTANYRQSEGAEETDQGTFGAGIRLPLGTLVFDGFAERGASRSGDAQHELTRYRSEVSWSTGVGTLAFGATRFDSGLGRAAPHGYLSGSLRLRAVEVEAAAGVPLDATRVAESLNLWSGLNLEVTRDFGLVMGLDYQPWTSGSPWRLSAGLRRRLQLPVPLPRIPAAEGVVFLDLNGNGRRDPGEPGVPGVDLTSGDLRATTDERGRFSFPDAGSSRSAVLLDATSLPEGLLLPTSGAAPATRRIEIPLVQPASLHFEIVLLEIGDPRSQPGGYPGGLDRPGPRPPARPTAGALVTLTDAHGRRYDVVADEIGAGRFSALAPGTYTLTVRRLPGLPGGFESVTEEITLVSGERLDHKIILRYRLREIRMRAGG